MECWLHCSWIVRISPPGPAFLLVALVSGLVPVRALAERPLVLAEGRVGAGVALGGGAGGQVWRAAPVTVGALAEVAVRSQPWTSLYGVALVETGHRVGVGCGGGIRVRPGSGELRLAVGARTLFAPYTLLGVSAGIGSCRNVLGVQVCGDIEGNAFFFGSDLPEDRVATQLQLVLGLAFDAL